jgi:hypothetical protein
VKIKNFGQKHEFCQKKIEYKFVLRKKIRMIITKLLIHNFKYFFLFLYTKCRLSEFCVVKNAQKRLRIKFIMEFPDKILENMPKPF